MRNEPVPGAVVDPPADVLLEDAVRVEREQLLAVLGAAEVVAALGL